VFGILSVVIGVVIGAASQVLLQLIGLRGSSLRLSLNFRHPALKQIVKLYVPVLGGLSVMLVGVAIDRNLASRTGDQSLAWMQAATYLVQLPLGLVSTAISFAILPNLSRAVAASEFKHTLTFGLKLVLLLILPCVVAMFVLAVPVVALLFEHGAFTAADSAQTARALQFYLFGTAFAAIDLPLVFAFYARRNTLTPNLVAVAGLAIYLVFALTLIGPLGYLGLVLANSAQLIGHALIMIVLTQMRLGGIEGEDLGRTTAKLVVASAAMGAVMIVLPQLSGLEGFVGEVLRVLIPALIGAVVYIVGLKLLRVAELEQVWGMTRARFGGIGHR